MANRSDVDSERFDSDRCSSEAHREVVQQVLDELVEAGVLVKALDEYGKPDLHKGEFWYKPIENATAAELAFSEEENRRKWQLDGEEEDKNYDGGRR